MRQNDFKILLLTYNCPCTFVPLRLTSTLCSFSALSSSDFSCSENAVEAPPPRRQFLSQSASNIRQASSLPVCNNTSVLTDIYPSELFQYFIVPSLLSSVLKLIYSCFYLCLCLILLLLFSTLFTSCFEMCFINKLTIKSSTNLLHPYSVSLVLCLFFCNYPQILLYFHLNVFFLILHWFDSSIFVSLHRPGQLCGSNFYECLPAHQHIWKTTRVNAFELRYDLR